MGYELYREVLRDAPAELCTSARLLLAVLADKANDVTRLTPFPPGMELLCHLTGLKPDAVRKAFRHLADKGLDPRLPIGKDKNGNPVYAMHGRRCEYRIPRMPKRELPWEDNGVTTVTPSAVTGVTSSVPEGVTPVTPSIEEGVTTVTPKALPGSREGVTTVTPISSTPSVIPSSQVLPPEGGGTPADDAADETLFPDLGPSKKAKPKQSRVPTLDQRAGAIVTAYGNVNKLFTKEAVFQVVKAAVKTGDWTDEEITDAMLKLASEKRPVTKNTLYIALNGTPRPSPNERKPYQNASDDAYDERYY